MPLNSSHVLLPVEESVGSAPPPGSQSALSPVDQAGGGVSWLLAKGLGTSNGTSTGAITEAPMQAASTGQSPGAGTWSPAQKLTGVMKAPASTTYNEQSPPPSASYNSPQEPPARPAAQPLRNTSKESTPAAAPAASAGVLDANRANVAVPGPEVARAPGPVPGSGAAHLLASALPSEAHGPGVSAERVASDTQPAVWNVGEYTVQAPAPALLVGTGERNPAGERVAASPKTLPRTAAPGPSTWSVGGTSASGGGPPSIGVWASLLIGNNMHFEGFDLCNNVGTQG